MIKKAPSHKSEYWDRCVTTLGENKIKNANIHDKVGVTSMMDKTRDARLRWLDMWSRVTQMPVKRCESLNRMGIKSGRYRLKKY